MKKILFATTALVASAGIASAQGVELEGSAELGVVGGDRYQVAQTDDGGNFDGYENVDQLWTDVEVRFVMTGEADNGLSYGAHIDLDEAMNANGTDEGGATFFLAFGGARLDMGDTDGAFDAAMTEVALVGTIDDTETAYPGYSGNAGLDGRYNNQVARFSYSFDAFTGHLSVEMDDNGNYEPIYGVGFSYAADLAGFNLGFGIGHQQGDEDYSQDSYATANNDIGTAFGNLAPGNYTNSELLEVLYNNAGAVAAEQITGVSLSATSDAGFQTVLNYSEAEYAEIAGLNQNTETHSAIGLSYTMNALSLGVSYSQYNNRFGVDGLEANGYAVAANYDLGGGLEVQAGYSRGEVSDDDGNVGFDDSFETDSYSVGLAMSF